MNKNPGTLSVIFMKKINRIIFFRNGKKLDVYCCCNLTKISNMVGILWIMLLLLEIWFFLDHFGLSRCSHHYCAVFVRYPRWDWLRFWSLPSLVWINWEWIWGLRFRENSIAKFIKIWNYFVKSNSISENFSWNNVESNDFANFFCDNKHKIKSKCLNFLQSHLIKFKFFNCSWNSILWR